MIFLYAITSFGEVDCAEDVLVVYLVLLLVLLVLKKTSDGIHPFYAPLVATGLHAAHQAHDD